MPRAQFKCHNVTLVSLSFQVLVKWIAGGKTPDWAKWRHESGKWRVSTLIKKCTASCRSGDLRAGALLGAEAWHQAESWFEGRVLEWYAAEQAPALSLGKVTPAPFPRASPRAPPHFGVDQGHAFGVNLQIILTTFCFTQQWWVHRCRWD